MARKGNGTSDNLLSGSFTQVTNYSVHFIYENDSAPASGSNSQPFAVVGSLESFGVSWNHGTAGFRGAVFHRDAVGYKAAKFGTLGANTQYGLGVSFDGSNIRSYQDGVLQTTTAAGNPVGTSPQLSLLSGNKGTASYDDGEISEFALWDVDLTADEFLALTAGVSPLLIRPGSLLNYWPILGAFSPEIDRVGGNDLTVTGTTKASHPKVYYAQQQIIMPPAAAPPAGVIMNQFQGPNLGADLYNGTLL